VLRLDGHRRRVGKEQVDSNFLQVTDEDKDEDGDGDGSYQREFRISAAARGCSVLCAVQP
jgi:hypothetical protein